MTVIAWDGETLATDRQVTQGEHKFMTEDKVWYSPTGPMGECLISGFGPLASILRRREWIINGGDIYDEASYDKGIGATMIMVVRARHIKYKVYVYEDGVLVPILAGGGFNAFGEGAPYAQGALHAGATASIAVTVANEYSLQCGLGVLSYTLNMKGRIS